jgi:hypothetical protein
MDSESVILLKYGDNLWLCQEYIKTSGGGYNTSTDVMKYVLSLPVFTVWFSLMTPFLFDYESKRQILVNVWCKFL